MAMEVDAVIYIVRHAQTDHNRNKLLQGHLDTKLDYFGSIQAERCGEYLAKLGDGKPFDAVFGSDLQRCRDTADLILKHTNTKPMRKKLYAEFSAGLRERDMGELDGLNVHEAQTLCSAMAKNFRSFGEPPQVAADRIKRQTLRLIATIRNRHLKRILVVTHSSVIVRMLTYLERGQSLVVPQRLDDHNFDFDPVHNTAVSQVWMMYRGPLVLQSYGDTKHLDISSLDLASGYNMDAQLEEYDKIGPS